MGGFEEKTSQEGFEGVSKLSFGPQRRVLSASARVAFSTRVALCLKQLLLPRAASEP
jgi:hypothetical protein